MLYKTFIISTDKLFWGWKSIIDVDEFNTITKIIEEVKKQLKIYLQKANLADLVKKVDDMKDLHIHCSENKIFENTNNEDIYLCDHH